MYARENHESKFAEFCKLWHQRKCFSAGRKPTREEKKPAREWIMREEKKPTREGAKRERKRYVYEKNHESKFAEFCKLWH